MFDDSLIDEAASIWSASVWRALSAVDEQMTELPERSLALQTTWLTPLSVAATEQVMFSEGTLTALTDPQALLYGG